MASNISHTGQTSTKTLLMDARSPSYTVSSVGRAYAMRPMTYDLQTSLKVHGFLLTRRRDYQSACALFPIHGQAIMAGARGGAAVSALSAP